MLKVHNLSKTFFKGSVNEKIALNELNFELNSGEFVIVIGANGSGKSTFLNSIAGTLTSDDGSITLDDITLNNMPEYKRAKYIGRVFQDPMKGTAPTMTIAENLSMALRRGKSNGLSKGLKKNDFEKFKQRLSTLNLGLENRIHSKVGLLSGGQRQAVTLLMATITQPKLLLLDEHTAALDPVTAKIVLQITKGVIEEQKLSALMVTHNMKDALTYGDRTIMMYEGRIILDLRGEERKEMTIENLIDLFHKKSGEDLDSDRMLLS